MLDKSYRPDEVEGKLYSKWMEQGAFSCGRAKTDETYTIVIPPPNVTGSLHMGHALNNTLQDALIRFERMRGKDVLWQPGMDHAGIATQMVVERADGTRMSISPATNVANPSGTRIFPPLYRQQATIAF